MSKTVLIVDDSMAMRRMIAFTLESSGFSVIQGSNGVEGLERLNEHPADLIIADVNMPVMDGITFVRHARTRL
jgi:two-component system chemotaxis response regulator CheY